MLRRPTSADDREDLKMRVRAALRAVRANAFALVTRGEEGTLSRYGSDTFPDTHMPIDVLADLEREHMDKFGAPSPVLSQLAALIGMKLVPAGEGDGAASVGLGDILDVSREGADVVQSLGRALADGRVDGRERDEVRGEIAQNIVALQVLDRKLAGGR